MVLYGDPIMYNKIYPSRRMGVSYFNLSRTLWEDNRIWKGSFFSVTTTEIPYTFTKILNPLTLLQNVVTKFGNLCCEQTLNPCSSRIACYKIKIARLVPLSWSVTDSTARNVRVRRTIIGVLIFSLNSHFRKPSSSYKPLARTWQQFFKPKPSSNLQ